MSTFKQRFARRIGVTEKLGTWNAQTNQPALLSGVGQKNSYYVVSVAGSTNLNGISDWEVNDWVYFNGSSWEKIDNSELTEVVDSMEGDETTKAPSVSAVKAYVSANGGGGGSGEDGASAYEIAVENGFVGTESQWLASLVGAAGAQGPKGDKGDQGEPGPAGADGAAGAQGPAGEAGPQGPQGAQGPVGPAGADGAQGAKGDKGDQGEPGPVGPQGVQGPKGDKGDTGETGPQGPAGVDGNTSIDDAIIDGVTNRAPSQNAVFDALASAARKLSIAPNWYGMEGNAPIFFDKYEVVDVFFNKDYYRAPFLRFNEAKGSNKIFCQFKVPNTHVSGTQLKLNFRVDSIESAGYTFSAKVLTYINFAGVNSGVFYSATTTLTDPGNSTSVLYEVPITTSDGKLQSISSAISSGANLIVILEILAGDKNIDISSDSLEIFT